LTRATPPTILASRSIASGSLTGATRSILELRLELLASGFDGGAQTLAHHLAGRVDKLAEPGRRPGADTTADAESAVLEPGSRRRGSGGLARLVFSP
jgi:hypothetical protein